MVGAWNTWKKKENIQKPLTPTPLSRVSANEIHLFFKQTNESIKTPKKRKNKTITSVVQYVKQIKETTNRISYNHDDVMTTLSSKLLILLLLHNYSTTTTSTTCTTSWHLYNHLTKTMLFFDLLDHNATGMAWIRTKRPFFLFYYCFLFVLSLLFLFLSQKPNKKKTNKPKQNKTMETNT